MARIFNRAYDQADRILNGSGLSSVVYRQGGGGMITSVHGKPIPRYVYRDNGGPVIRRFMGGYTDEDFEYNLSHNAFIVPDNKS